MEIKVRKAERTQKALKMLLGGPSGSGKTYSALLLAKGMGGKILFMDTENKSADLYADLVDFEKVDIEAPYTTEKYIEVMAYAEANGYNTLVIDSFTHAWAGEGGLLDQKAIFDMKPGSNSFVNFGKITPMHEKLKSAIIKLDINLIGCLRAKAQHEIVKDEQGKTKIEKLGTEVIQREGFEFEFDTAMMLDMNHMASTARGKDRTRLFEGKYFTISEQTGKDLIAWKQSAKPVERTPEQEKAYLLDKCKVLGVTFTDAEKAEMKAKDIPAQVEALKQIIKSKEAK
jgi:hypothetical protein